MKTQNNKMIHSLIVGLTCLIIIAGCNKSPSEIQIHYPINNALFPPEIIAPRIWWTDASSADQWTLTFTFADGHESITVISSDTTWIPQQDQWEIIKHRSLENPLLLTIDGLKTGDKPDIILSTGRITFSTSKDSVGAPIFYREVPLPFKFARMNLKSIRWLLGNIGSYNPPQVLMTNLNTCANCHSFTTDGKIMGMDVDFRLDKGGYIVTPFDETTVWTKEKIISWSDYDRSLKIPTFGLLSSLSPDGQYVLSGVRDRSIFLDQDDLYFSQLFFPVTGILSYYDTGTKTFHDLPGADNPQFVQSNGVWSPDGKTILFSRSKATQLTFEAEIKTPTLLRQEAAEVLGGEQYVDADIEGRKKFLFNLYKMPFNGGNGGQAVPVEGASHNGRSNYFPKYSPDGKWIVFCQASSYMLNQKGSELYIMPAQGGIPRRMNCNTSRMNSWHSWSPNSKWLVFSAKEYGPYTQLFLTHIDEEGNDTPPVLLRDFTPPFRAANIPEFVNIKPDAVRKIVPKEIY